VLRGCKTQNYESDFLTSYHHASSVFQRYCPTTAYYFASMDRRRHDISHETCVEKESCEAKSTGEGTSSRHVTADCACISVSVDEEELMRILENNKIPLIRCKYSSDGPTRLSLIEWRDGLNYTAVSHVSFKYSSS
jgi:hypothetical protein